MANNNHPAFNPLDLFKRVDTQAVTRDYQNRQVIFAQGDKADAMFYIQDGSVKLTVDVQGWKKGRDCHFATGRLFRRRLSGKTIVADVYRNRDSVLHHRTSEEGAPCSRHSARARFAKVFIAYLLSRIGRVEEKLVDQISSSSERRLAKVLLLLAGVGLQSTPAEPVILKVSQETLAEMVGTTRSRVSYFMNRFRKMGLIDYNGTLQVHRGLLTLFSTSKDEH